MVNWKSVCEYDIPECKACKILIVVSRQMKCVHVKTLNSQFQQKYNRNIYALHSQSYTLTWPDKEVNSKEWHGHREKWG